MYQDENLAKVQSCILIFLADEESLAFVVSVAVVVCGKS